MGKMLMQIITEKLKIRVEEYLAEETAGFRKNDIKKQDEKITCRI